MLCRFSCARAAVSAHGSVALWLQRERVDAAARGAQQARPSRRPRRLVRCPLIGLHRQPSANRRVCPSTRPPAPLAKCGGRRASVSASAAPSLSCTAGRVVTQSPLRQGASVPLGAWPHASLWSRLGRSRGRPARRATGGLGVDGGAERGSRRGTNVATVGGKEAGARLRVLRARGQAASVVAIAIASICSLRSSRPSACSRPNSASPNAARARVQARVWTVASLAYQVSSWAA